MGRYDLPDPKCRHAQHAVMVSSHEDLVAASKTDEAMCSVWVCHREACIEDAKQWVYANTHRTPVLKRKAVTQ